jgi:ABC-type sugar transport system permease subunit
MLARKPRRSTRPSQLKFVLAVLVPACAWLIAFRYGPIIYLALLSLRNWQALSAGMPSFVGLANFREALTADPLFWTAVRNTVQFTVLYLAIQIPLALLIAIGIESLRKEFWRQTTLTAYFMPLVTSMAATGILFVFLYNPVNGLFNHILRSVGLQTLSFLKSPSTALNSIVLMDVWKGIGFPIVIFYAGLQAIPREYYDAAATDGANALARFRYITWPLLKPTTALLLTIQLVETMKVFTPIYVMTATGSRQPGGPLNSTLVWSLHIYNQAFRFNRFGYGAALAMLMFVLVFVVLAIQLRLTRTEANT